jgi:hypothetical protein
MVVALLRVVGFHPPLFSSLRSSVSSVHHKNWEDPVFAHHNRPLVLRYVQMLQLVGIAFFQDLLSLDLGQRWARQLYHHIDVSDVLFLFWSTPAKQSKWVTKEWRYGLRKKGLDFIKPVIIEGPPPVPPPKALAKLHFNDWLLYVIRAGEAVRGNSTLAK